LVKCLDNKRNKL